MMKMTHTQILIRRVCSGGATKQDSTEWSKTKERRRRLHVNIMSTFSSLLTS